MWRYDGHMVWPVWPNAGNDNVMLAQSNNWYDMLKQFKDTNQNAGLFGCSSGGESISLESTRYTDTQQTSDGIVYHYDGYWLSLFVPPDKLSSTTEADYDRQNWGTAYSKDNRGNLGMSWIMGMNNASATQSAADKEALRKDVELYHYLKSQGVVGRWVKVYRPTVNTGDATYFLQKMSSDNSKGYITIRRYDAMTGNNITVYPKGLNPAVNYTVSALEGGRATATNTGSYWMINGITLTPLITGEMIFFNLQDRPGTGNDATAPTTPTNVKKLKASYMWNGGIELNWTAASDNNWISYYEIFKNGVSIDKVSKGTFYFTTSGKITDTFEVRTVDGDGNVSSKATATDDTPAADPKVYPAFSDFSSVQGQRNWYYQQWNGSTYSNITWDSVNNRWQGSETFVLVGDNWQHPDNSYDSVRKWVAPNSGKVRL